MFTGNSLLQTTTAPPLLVGLLAMSSLSRRAAKSPPFTSRQVAASYSLGFTLLDPIKDVLVIEAKGVGNESIVLPCQLGPGVDQMIKGTNLLPSRQTN